MFKFTLKHLSCYFAFYLIVISYYTVNNDTFKGKNLLAFLHILKNVKRCNGTLLNTVVNGTVFACKINLEVNSQCESSHLEVFHRNKFFLISYVH